jgi:hypothetical protein
MDCGLHGTLTSDHDRWIGRVGPFEAADRDACVWKIAENPRVETVSSWQHHTSALTGSNSSSNHAEEQEDRSIG